MSFRIEQDSIGKIKVPSKAYYGAQIRGQYKILKLGGLWSSV